MIDEKLKKTIDGMSYEELLNKLQFDPLGDQFFKGEIGDCYANAFEKKWAEIDDPAIHAAINKKIR